MKVRKGFVSNSSSSSFVCDVCHENVSGMDMGLIDAQMFECTGGHTVCDSHELKNTTIFYSLDLEAKRARCLELAKEAYADEDQIIEAKSEEELDIIFDEELSEEDRYNRPKDCCPICQLKNLTNEQILEYLLAKAGTTQEETVKEIQEKFSDYNDMRKKLKL